jgi:hypothetical protein
MKTTLEVTLRITVHHPVGGLDSNSVKATVNAGMAAITDEGAELLTTTQDETVESVCVEVVKFKEDGKRQALSLYGTDEVPWGRA